MAAPRPRAALRAALAALVLGGLFVSGHVTAQADPLSDARHKAALLRSQVDALQTKAEIASEAYDAAYAKLGVAVTEHLTAEKQLSQAQQAAGSTDELAGRRVRALYMSGGTTGLYAHILDSGSIAEVVQRVDQVRVVLADDHQSTAAANLAVRSSRDAERRLAQSAAVSTALQKVVADRADQVQSLLAQASALLAQADQRVLAIADQQRRAAQAAAAARDAAVLAAARAAAGNLPEVPATPLAAAALDFAREQLGKPYLWGATGPDAYDCSGLTGAAYQAAGVTLGRTSRDQWNDGPHVGLGELLPGDLLFWATDVNDPSTIHHVALYAGNGMMVAAPHTGDVVRVQPVYLDGYIGAVRPGVSG